MLLSKIFWKPVLWCNVKTSNIEYYDIQYAPERTKSSKSDKIENEIWNFELDKFEKFDLVSKYERLYRVVVYVSSTNK